MRVCTIAPIRKTWPGSDLFTEGLGMATLPIQAVFSRDPDNGETSIHVDLMSVSARKSR